MRPRRALPIIMNATGETMARVNSNEALQPSASGIETLTIKVNGDNIFLRKAGKGPPVLLLHGGACDSADWEETMLPLSDSYTLFAPDLLGYGSSERNQEAYFLSDFADSVRGLIEALKLDTPLAIVGHSLGGRVALELALNHPDRVRKLALIDTAGFSRLARWGSFIVTMAYIVRKVLGRPQPYPRFKTESGTMPEWLCLDELPKVRVPTLIVWNQRDPYYTVKGALKAKKMMPQAQLEILPGYGHAPHRTERESFNRILAGFLAEP